ncbi:DUF2891 domain-containing protein [Pedobacter sp. SYP-B3415]|uniref:DUF2891 domain-containing protein n=1 Tax=Pedobacter sp. SYP-B3415 TaxID=2496641 RepID=UPI00101CBD0C|nr:DUF2891 domain-containing protein [Pedobacter sp. SYP-B3415]
MHKILRYALLPALVFCCAADIQAQSEMTADVAAKLSQKPLECIFREYPNKTSHVAGGEADAKLQPSELHPAFYGCFDWHSSVHGHWMLLRLLKTQPTLANRNEIIKALNRSFDAKKMQEEAAYFGKYEGAGTYERTYGWAWLLKLDEELYTWNTPEARRWRTALLPLTEKIVQLWKAYLPKQTYPNRTGVHPNTAFGLVFALDWARTTGDTAFARAITEKARAFYADNTLIPAHLEPDGSDFFSPSLQAADLMRRVLPAKAFVNWLDKYYDQKGLARITSLPVISDINDYQIVHLVGLSFTRAWCMKGIAARLPAGHPLKSRFNLAAQKFLANALPLVFKGNYGGDHWLASFAVYALEDPRKQTF